MYSGQESCLENLSSRFSFQASRKTKKNLPDLSSSRNSSSRMVLECGNLSSRLVFHHPSAVMPERKPKEKDKTQYVYVYIYIYMGEPSHFGRIWVTKTLLSPVFGLKKWPKHFRRISAKFLWAMACFNTKISFFSPVLAAFSIKMLKTGEIYTFFKKWARLGKC